MIEWLNRYRNQYNRVEDILASVEKGDITCSRIDGLPKGDHINTLDEVIISNEILRVEFNTALDKLKSIRSEITQAIDQISNKTAARVLYLRYISLLSWNKISEQMHYTQGHIYRLHSMGIEKLKMIVNASK